MANAISGLAAAQQAYQPQPQDSRKPKETEATPQQPVASTKHKEVEATPQPKVDTVTISSEAKQAGTSTPAEGLKETKLVKE